MTMMEGIISFMTDRNPDIGLGSMETTIQDKKDLANNSLTWNLENHEFIKIFPDIHELIKNNLD